MKDGCNESMVGEKERGNILLLLLFFPSFEIVDQNNISGKCDPSIYDR